MADILGISANELNGKSFYYCIQENCLREAVKCLESAKANDSIAYLRFWFRDPRQDERIDHDEHMSDAHSSGDEDETGGVHLSEMMEHDDNENAIISDSSNSMRSSIERDQIRPGNDTSLDPNSRTSSGDSSDTSRMGNDAIFDQPLGGQSRTSSISTPDESGTSNASWSRGSSRIELEAVVSCTSDGLVVILRRAKPIASHVSNLPQSIPNAAAAQPYANGLFASPWASEPIMPTVDSSHNILPDIHRPEHGPITSTAPHANTSAAMGPPTEDFMNSIREVVVFAWSLTGINGSLEQYARGIPMGESQPPGGLPVWEPDFIPRPESVRPNIAGFLTNDQYDNHNPRSNEHPRDENPYYGTMDPSTLYGDPYQLSKYDLSGLPRGYGAYPYSNGHDTVQADIYNSTGVTDGHIHPDKLRTYPHPPAREGDTSFPSQFNGNGSGYNSYFRGDR